MEPSNQPSTTGDLRELHLWSMVALQTHKISPKDADEITRLGKAYDQLFNYQTTYSERTAGKILDAGAVPSIDQLKPLIAADDFPAVVSGAKKIHDLMKPILQHAKSLVNALPK